MTVYSARVVIGSAMTKADAIEHEGKLWLVPNWLDTPDGKWTMPTRIVRFDNLPHSDLRGRSQIDFVLDGPMPKELFDARTPQPPVAGIEYHELPNIRIARR
jgi:hypothetical protein